MNPRTWMLLLRLATACLLARGERWLWRVTDRLVPPVGPSSGRVRRRRPVVVPALGAFLAPIRWALTGPRAPPFA